ncbi:BrnA antitoxin family protein [Microvirga terrestris]|uniref:BrnA antitoxin family protein n=1 Tax=Microvirga terrestris TaxID=2791024 RepID=A0ABS0HX68_9HYPH|nr:BrnA antitoxin family protein [Microvirga terrestris]MBF9198117.1 BrnA antitoxin family protein [Microvirga terrestris]
MAKVKPNPAVISKDNPEWTEANFARAKPLAEVLPELAAVAKRPGRPRSENPKVLVSLRLDPDVVAAYKATGPGWQARINEILRRGMPEPPSIERKKT